MDTEWEKLLANECAVIFARTFKDTGYELPVIIIFTDLTAHSMVAGKRLPQPFVVRS